MPTVNREQFATDWTSRGFTCDLWTDPSGQCWEDFRHATDELAVVLEGDTELEIAGKVERPRAGEALLTPAGAVHSARVSAHHGPLAVQLQASRLPCGCRHLGLFPGGERPACVFRKSERPGQKSAG